MRSRGRSRRGGGGGATGREGPAGQRRAALDAERRGLRPPLRRRAAALSRLTQVFRRLEDLAEIDPSFRPFLDARRESSPPRGPRPSPARLPRAARVSPGRLDEIEGRLAVLERLKKKYGATIEEVLAFASAAAASSTPSRRRRSRADARGPRDRLAAAYLERAASSRRSGGPRRASSASASRPSSPSSPWRRRGSRWPSSAGGGGRGRSRALDRAGPRAAEFLLSPNPGEELRPWPASRRAASCPHHARPQVGRPLRRAGLSLVFDEVDAGIGGAWPRWSVAS